MGIASNSIAAANAVGVKNTQFSPTASVLQRKILIIGSYDPAKTLVVADTPKLVLSAADVGDYCGFGFMLHRLAVSAFEGGQGVPTYIIPQAEAGGAAAAAGNITFTATSVTAGTIYLYISGLRVPVNVATGDNGDAIAAKVIVALDALSADFGLPTTQLIDGVNANEVDLTAKSKGPYGNDISITFNWGEGEEFPVGLTSAVVVAMTGGTGVPDINDALNAIGTGDGQNEAYYTDLIQGYGQDSGTLDALSTYNGAGNTFIGNYSKEVARPFRSLVGDVVVGSGGLAALVVIGDGRKLDRTSGIIAIPGSPNHPEEIAAQAVGVMARTNNNRAEESTIDKTLAGIIPGAKADRWTSEYDSRDTAVKAGISTTLVKSGVITIQNIVTFYHPDSIPQSSNGYRSQRNISILQNLLNATKLNFEGEKWDGISIVADKTKVGTIEDRKKVRDLDDVIDDLVILSQAFESNAWIYTADFTIGKLQGGGLVAERAGLTGFDMTLPVILSGEGGILNTEIEFDTSIAVLV